MQPGFSKRRLYFVSGLWVLAAPWLLVPGAPDAIPALFVIALIVTAAIPVLVHRRTPLDPFLLAYLILAVVSVVVSPLPAQGLARLAIIVAGFSLFSFTRLWLQARTGAHEALAALLALGGMALAAAAPLIVAWPVSEQVVNLSGLYRVLGAARVPGAVVHRNEMAGTLVLLLPFAVAYARRGRSLSWRWLGVGLTAAVLLLSQSRAAWLALVASALIWWLGRRNLAKGRLLIAAVLSLLLASAALLFSPAAQGWLTRLDAATKSGGGLSWAGRIELWSVALQMWQDYPVLGGGLYLFEPVSKLNYTFTTFSPDFAFVHAHNLVLQTGATLGVPAVLALLGLLGVLFAGLWRAARGNGPQAGQGALYAAALGGFVVFNLFDLVWWEQRPGVLLWLVLAGAVSALSRPVPGYVEGSKPVETEAEPVETEAEPVETEAEPVEAGSSMHNFLQRSGATGLRWAPLLAFLLLLPALPRNLANLRLDRAQLLGEPAPGRLAATLAGDARRRGLLAYTRGDDAAALAAWEEDHQAGLFLQGRGFIAHRRRDTDSALHFYSLALALEPALPQAYYWRGLLYETRGDWSAAAADWELAAYYAERQGLEADWLERIDAARQRLCASSDCR